MYVIKNLLTIDEVNQILSTLDGWQEGHTNADKSHKDNQELIVEESSNFIAKKIQSHSYATTRLFVKSMTLPRFNKYGKDQKYNRHVDAFKQLGVQTDWSYTLCLQPAIQGGQLEIEIDGHLYAPPLEAGDIVIYPSGNIHAVTPVTEGERISAIGWIESLITRPDERAILTSLVSAMQELDGRGDELDLTAKLAFSYHNLLRLWSK